MFTNVFRAWGSHTSQILRRSFSLEAAVQKTSQISPAEQYYWESTARENTRDFPYNAMTLPLTMGSKQEQREFMSVLPEIVENLINDFTDVSELKKHYHKLFNENLGRDKQAPGFLTVAAYKMFENPGKITPENVKLASVLGWCVNIVPCAYTLTDDIMDGSKTRFGTDCWYRKERVGLKAINDAILMENGIYLILRRYFSKHKCYVPAAEWLHDMSIKTLIGQTLDTLREEDGKLPLRLFTWSTYNYLIKNKGTYPVYMLPVILGIMFADKYNDELYKQTDDILTEIGLFFTAQNDMLDCYGDPAVTGKVGTDIVQGRCSWLVVKALERATPAQRRLLDEHYGRPDRDSELKIRTLYDELGIVDEFSVFEEQSLNHVCQVIETLPNEMHRKFFNKLVDVTYGRN